MKKYGFLFLIMVAAFALLLSGCTQTTPSDKAGDEGGAVTTTAPLPTEPLNAQAATRTPARFINFIITPLMGI